MIAYEKKNNSLVGSKGQLFDTLSQKLILNDYLEIVLVFSYHCLSLFSIDVPPA